MLVLMMMMTMVMPKRPRIAMTMPMPMPMPVTDSSDDSRIAGATKHDVGRACLRRTGILA